MKSINIVSSGGLKVVCRIRKFKVAGSTPDGIDRLSGCKNDRNGCQPLEDWGGRGRGKPVDESAAKETKGGDVRNESHHTLSLFPRSHPSIYIRTMVRKNRADSGESKQNRTLQKEGVGDGASPHPLVHILETNRPGRE
ncbi:hypothetical protein TNCV_1033341 [Trichonephila clavipes]|nr:hypothetical protein TNCV_1033341 [Trichonephila clavipes]